jgi:hypothetical protein
MYLIVHSISILKPFSNIKFFVSILVPIRFPFDLVYPFTINNIDMLLRRN